MIEEKRKEKIDEIMRLAGVASRDFEAARHNYEQLDDAEIDRRLMRLRKGSDWLQDWRAQNGWVQPLSELEQINAQVLSAAGTSLEKVDRIERSLETIAGAIASRTRKKGIISTLAAQIRDTEKRLVQHAIRHFTDDNSARAMEFIRRRIEAIASLNELAALEALRELGGILQHPVIPLNLSRLTITGTIDALARIENGIARRPPDLIVALNEGKTIALMIMHHLQLNCPLISVLGSADTHIEWDDQARFVRPKTVWVLGHVCRKAETLTRVIGQASVRYQTSKVFGAVLAASIDAIENLPQFSYHQIVEGPQIQLAFDLTKEIRVRDDALVLQSSGTELIVPDTIFSHARKDMAIVYPVKSIER